MIPSIQYLTKLALEIAWRRRYLICVPLVLLPPLGFVIGSFMPHIYEVRTSFLIQETAKLNPFLTDLAIGPDLKDRMPALTTLLRSEHVLSQVLSDLGMTKKETSEKDRQQAVKTLAASISADVVGSDLVEIRLRNAVRDGSARLLESIRNRFIERLLSPERSSLTNSQTFLEKQLDERKAILRKAEDAYSNFKRVNADKLPAIYSMSVTRLASLHQQLEDKSMELAAANAAYADIRKRLDGTNPVIGRLEEAIVSASGELVSLRARYTDEHSAVKTAEQQLRRLNEERAAIVEANENLQGLDLDRLWSIAANASGKDEKGSATLLVSQMIKLQEAQSRQVILQQDVAHLNEAIAQVQRSIAEIAPIEQQQQALEHDITLAREMVDALAKRFEMARVTGALGLFEGPERIKIIDSPVDPLSPVSPGRLIFMIAGIGAGLFLGLGLAAVAEVTDRRIRYPSQITGLPILARLE